MTVKIVWLVLIFSSLLHAVSFGLSVPLNITEEEELSYGSFGDVTYTYKYKNATGLGFVLDTNVAKESTFGYRLLLQYTLGNLDSTDNPNVTDLKKHKYDMIHNFTFGVVHKPGFRWWVGPRINIQIEHASGSDISYQNSWGFGVGAATGVNFKVAERIGLGVDLAYQGAMLFGSERESGEYSSSFATSKGVTTQFYLLFVFGEGSKVKQQSSIIDNSL